MEQRETDEGEEGEREGAQTINLETSGEDRAARLPSGPITPHLPDYLLDVFFSS